MYIVFIILCAVYLLFYIKHRSAKKAEGRKGIKGIFDGISAEMLIFFAGIRNRFIRYKVRDGPGKISEEKLNISSILIRLKPGEKKEILYREYVIGKLSLSLMVIFVGTALAAGMHFKSRSTKDAILDGKISREEVSGESRQYGVEAHIRDDKEEFQITVSPRIMSEAEAEDLLPDFYEDLGKALARENESLERVTGDVDLVKKVEGYPFSVDWSSSDTELIAAGTGKVAEVYENVQVVLTAMIRYRGMEFTKEYFLTLVPREYTREEALRAGLEKAISESDRESENEKEWVLPKSYEGEAVDWTEIRKDYSVYVFFGVVGIAVLIYKMSDRDLNAKLEERKKKLKKSYPDFLQKLLLYCGAGMTLRGAFQKIALGAGQPYEPIYEEIIYTCREMRSGIPEEEVYERFGKRCGIQEYIRVSTLISQNLKKGSSNLMERLKEEADNASRERIQNCRRAGEEAVTKLLLPMVMMLLVVMVMILLPAFSNMDF